MFMLYYCLNKKYKIIHLCQNVKKTDWKGLCPKVKSDRDI